MISIAKGKRFINQPHRATRSCECAGFTENQLKDLLCIDLHPTTI